MVLFVRPHIARVRTYGYNSFFAHLWSLYMIYVNGDYQNLVILYLKNWSQLRFIENFQSQNIFRNNTSTFKVALSIAQKKHACIHKKGENIKDNMHKIKSLVWFVDAAKPHDQSYLCHGREKNRKTSQWTTVFEFY